MNFILGEKREYCKIFFIKKWDIEFDRVGKYCFRLCIVLIGIKYQRGKIDNGVERGNRNF